MSHSEVVLEHHGVKGMHWGVQKEDDTNGDFSISKDNPLYNISAEKPRDNKGQIYAAFTKQDVVNYRANYTWELKTFKGADKVFSNAFDLKKDIKVAGEKSQIETFQKLWESDKDGVAKALARSQVDIKISAAIVNRLFHIDRTNAYEKKFQAASEKYMLDKGFKQFQQSLATPGNNLKTPYYSLLAKSGYSALLDVNDLTAMNSEKPVLIFKGESSLKKKNSLELTETDFQLALDTYSSKDALMNYDVDKLHAKHMEWLVNFLMHEITEGEGVETTNAQTPLVHFGVKGMHWGVHKNDSGGSSGTAAKTPKGDLVLSEKLKSGETISIYKKPPPPLARFISKYSESYKKDADAFAMFSMHDKAGKKVGDAAFVRDSKSSLYLDWIGIKQSERGKGYASSALRGVVKYAQNEGISKLTLEVPTNAPDARHIYEKLGFKGGKTVVDKNDPVFGGLTKMSLDVPKPSAKHADDSEDDAFADAFGDFLIKHFSDQSVIQHSDSVENVFAHFGIKGMKWGHKKAKPASSADAASKAATKVAAKKSGVRTISNNDLQAAIRRMQLEQDFKRLSVNEQSGVKRWVSSTLLEIGKREVQQRVAKKAATIVVKKAVTGGAA